MQNKARRVLAYMMAMLMVIGCFQGISLKGTAAEVDVPYTFADLQKAPYYVYGIETDTVDQSGVLTVTYNQGWGQTAYLVPQDIDISTVKSISFTMASDNGGSMCFKTLDSSYTEIQAAYGNTTMELNAASKESAAFIAIDNMAATMEDGSPFTASIAGVSFKVEQADSQDPAPTFKESYQTIRKTYSLGSLKEVKKYGVTYSVNEKSGATSFSFSGQYQEVDFAIPADVDGANLTSIEVKYKSGNGFALKNFTAADLAAGANQTDVDYNGASLATSAGKDARTAVGLMNLSDGANECVVESVTFVCNANPTYPMAALQTQSGGGVSVTTGADGSYALGFASQYQEIAFAVPAAVMQAGFSNVKFNLTAGDVSNLAVKIYNQADWDAPDVYQTDVAYWADSLAVSADDIVIIALSNTGTDPKEITVSGVTFTTGESSVVGVDPDADNGDGGNNQSPADLTYDASNTQAQSWGTAITVDGTKYQITFAKQYDQAYIPLPEPVMLANCASITFNVENQNGPIALKLYDGNNGDIEVKYGQSGSTSYTIVPTKEDICTAVSIMTTEADPTGLGVTLVSVVVKMKEDGGVEKGENLIVNPDFADADLSAWSVSMNGGGTLKQGTSQTPVVGNITTYGIVDRTLDKSTSSQSDCFAQDVTDKVKKNGLYEYEFYVCLSEDYANAPEAQRQVDFQPYVTTQGEGTQYYGSWSQGIITGNSSQRLTPGVWTKYSGTFTVKSTGTLEAVVLRIIEQGSDYADPDSCIYGDYYVTGVSLKEIIQEEKEIQQDVPNLKDAVKANLGADTIVGTAFTQGELNDELLQQLARKHFNAVTLGNELKLDAMLGYRDSISTSDLETVVFNGEELLVPKLDYSRADGMLNVIKAWNDENPSEPIKVRGHVLVWHSQTRDWFFKENYDANGAYVSKDVMDKRLEWYIATMMEHYTGANSKYKGMFYGWDVVNEAINDSTNTYRGANESNWAKVYGDQSNEYIIKAFRFANKYAPADLELYYNDYNDCVPGKVAGIVKLLQAVLAADGTRISAMGMQAHHNMTSPTIAQMESAVRAYCAVVGKVQFTEFDLKASSAYDGSAAAKEVEFEKQAYRYKEMYDLLVNLEAEDGIDVSGITMWGLIDKNSWLQGNAGVGGGTNGTQPQCPLLFDDNYQVKPAFWSFVDATQLKPEVKEIVVISKNDENKGAKSYVIGDNKAVFTPVWENGKVTVTVVVNDATADENDAVTVYVDPSFTQADGASVKTVTVKRADATASANGYTAEVTVDVLSGLKVAEAIGLDVVVVDGNTKAAFDDFTFAQETTSKYYAKAVMKPYAQVDRGTAVIDGVKDAVYTEKGVEIPLSINLNANASAKATLLWDASGLYVFAEITDADLNAENAEEYQHDSLEVFIDENNHKSEEYEADDKQYRVDYENAQSFNGAKCNASNIVSKTVLTDNGYIVEAVYKWTDIAPAAGTEIGFEIQINDADKSGKRIGTLSWYDESGMGWSKPAVFGTVSLKDTTPAPTPAPAVTTPAPAPVVVVDVKYVVQRGDNLTKIARKYGVTLNEILAMNPQITNPNRIHPGQTIVVGTTVSANGDKNEKPAAEKKFYVVVKGDNLTKIARKLKTPLAQIYLLNPELRRQKYIYPGQKIKIQ